MGFLEQAWFWFALLASLTQTLRNASQLSLTQVVGLEAGSVARFVLGLPCSLVVYGVIVLVGGTLPSISWEFVSWTTGGALAQVFATIALLAAMRERSFVVVTAYTKTEPAQVALFGLVLLGEAVTPLLVLAILLATVGVMMLSWPTHGRAFGEGTLRPTVLGIGSGTLFALSAVGFRGGVQALGDADFVVRATLTLVVALSLQTVATVAWLAWRESSALRAIFRQWRLSFASGFLGASTSELWFLAFSLERAAPVRTVGLIEVLFAGAVSRRLFSQRTRTIEWVGIGLVIAGILGVLDR